MLLDDCRREELEAERALLPILHHDDERSPPAGEDELSESGEDWDEAEKRALRDDRARRREDEDASVRPRKKTRR